MEIFKIITLALSALLLLFVGAMRLSNPIKTYLKNSGIQLGNDANLLNEIRGLSAVQLLGGIIIALGIFIPELTFSSFIVGTLMFIGFTIGRTISMNVDGKPNKQVTQILIFEFVFGIANMFCLFTILT